MERPRSTEIPISVAFLPPDSHRPPAAKKHTHSWVGSR